LFLKRIVRDYFTFNKRERRGFAVLVFILLVLCSVHLGMKLTPSESHPLSEAQILAIDELVAQSEREAALRDAQAQAVKARSSHDIKFQESKNIEEHQPEWTEFDPNTVDVETLKSTGLKPYLAERMVKYRNSGGSFHDLQDVARIYGMDSLWLQDAEAYMNFPTKPELAESKISEPWKAKPKKVLPKIDLNRADSATLVSISGIGPFYASNIVELRDQLGGFLDYQQLGDVYRMRAETIQLLTERTFIDSTAVTKIPLNSVTVEELASHKYLDWKTAKIIIAYRAAHGSFQKSSDILKTDVVTDSMYRKIAPYLLIE